MDKQTLEAALDAFMHRGMAEYEIPGEGVAVIQDGKICLIKGYGVRDMDSGLPIDENTVFRMASNTKSFTSMSLALLADEGKLEWDRPLKHYIPDFQMMDPYDTDHVNAIDLLSHRSGMYDHMVFDAAVSRKERAYLLRYLPPNCEMRTRHEYCSHAFTLAYYLLECITGEVWEHFVEQRILKPLGMMRSGFHMTPFLADGNAAHHVNREFGQGSFIPFPFFDDGYPDRYYPGSPGGGLCSSLKDTAIWAAFHVNEGVHEGVRLVSKDNMRMMHRRHMADEWPGSGRDKLNPASGLGWFVTSYMGYYCVNHPGFYDSFVSFLPGMGMGIVALPIARIRTMFLEETFANTAYDLMLGEPERDWLTIRSEQAKRYVPAPPPPPPAPDPTRPPTHPLSDYVGAYYHIAYKKLSITEAEGVLHAKFGWIDADMTHLWGDTFMVEGWMITFRKQADTTLPEAAVHPISAVWEIVFDRQQNETTRIRDERGE